MNILTFEEFLDEGKRVSKVKLLNKVKTDDEDFSPEEKSAKLLKKR